MDAKRNAGTRGSIYEKVAMELKVPLGNISRWMKNKEMHLTKAGKIERAKLMGVKAKNLLSVGKNRNVQGPGEVSGELRLLSAHIKDQIKERKRRAVTLPWLGELGCVF